MGLPDLFHRREAAQAKAGRPDVYQYDTLPPEFRYQVEHILRAAIGPYQSGYGSYNPIKVWDRLYDVMVREAGQPFLGSFGDSPKLGFLTYFHNAPTGMALSCIELAFRMIDRVVRQAPVLYGFDVQQDADSAIAELNGRFQEHGIGYRYEAGLIVKLNDEFTHEEIVRPALAALELPGFEGAADEFATAHRHYRQGHSKEALTAALSAFESTMKAVCDQRQWDYPKTNAGAKKLLSVLLENGLVPAELQDYFSGLEKVLISGLPTIAHRHGRHGQGSDVRTAPTHLVTFAVRQAAANIVLIIDLHRAT